MKSSLSRAPFHLLCVALISTTSLILSIDARLTSTASLPNLRLGIRELHHDERLDSNLWDELHFGSRNPPTRLSLKSPLRTRGGTHEKVREDGSFSAFLEFSVDPCNPEQTFVPPFSSKTGFFFYAYTMFMHFRSISYVTQF
jgi:hypothetical protein